MSGIFISYRRDDSEGQAGRLFEGLNEGDKIDMVLSIEDAVSSHEPVSFMLSRVVD